MPLILASASETRAALLRNAGVEVVVQPARVDEAAVREALAAEQATPRDVADALAEMKARKVAERHPGAQVLGCDQVAASGQTILAKPDSPEDAARQLAALSGQKHQLFSAAVLYDRGVPVWRHVGVARLTMRPLSDRYIGGYLARNWDSVRNAVGCYKLEEEGVRLFSAIEGDYFTVLGLPLLPLLAHLTQTGVLEG